MAARRVFLHAGLAKTGTTYLQEALVANQEELKRRGLLFPSVRRTHLLASLELREDPLLARRPRKIERPWEHLVELINRRPSRGAADAVISHEFFAPALPEQVARAVNSFPDHEFHLILTARPLVDLFRSRWQEWVKNGQAGGIDSYPPDTERARRGEWGWPSFDLGIVLDSWGAVLPPERIHVLPLEPGAGAPALCQTFLEVMGQSADGLTLPDAPANQSLGITEVEVLRRVNEQLSGFVRAQDRGRWIRGHLAERTLAGGDRERFRPAPATVADLLERERRALDLLRSAPYRIHGSLENLVSGDVSHLRHPDDVGPEQLLPVATATIAALLADLREATTVG